MQHAEKRLIKPVGTKNFYELPLNSPAGFLLETDEIDPYDAEERKAIEELELTSANATHHKKGSNHV